MEECQSFPEVWKRYLEFQPKTSKVTYAEAVASHLLTSKISTQTDSAFSVPESDISDVAHTKQGHRQSQQTHQNDYSPRISSCANYSPAFLQHKACEENHHISFVTGARDPITHLSLWQNSRGVLTHMCDTSPNLDAIHN